MDGKELAIELENRGKAIIAAKKEMRDMIVSFVKESPLKIGDVVKMGDEEVKIAAVGFDIAYKDNDAVVGPSKIFRKKKDGTFSKREELAYDVEKDGVVYKRVWKSVLLLDSNDEVGVSGETIYVGGVSI